MRGNESDIILFEAAAKELKHLGAVPLPTTERMKAKMDTLATRKAELKAERQQAQREERQYAAIQQNVDEFLSAPAEEQQHQRKQELE